MVSRGRTTATAGAAAARSPTTTKKAAAPTKKAAPAPTKKAAPAPKAPSPKPRKTITTAPKTAAVVSGVKVTPKPTTQRKVITQQPAGQAVQQQFKQAVSSAVQSVGIDFGVATVKTTVQETPTEVITIIEKPEEEVIIEEVIPEEEVIIEEVIPEEEVIIEEEIPEVFGEIDIVLTDQVKQIISDIENGVVLVPDWFRNNIEWVKTGQITQQEFVTAYNYAVDQGWIHAPTEEEIEVIEEEKEKEVTKKPSKTNGRFNGVSAVGIVAALVLIGAAVTVYKKEGN